MGTRRLAALSALAIGWAGVAIATPVVVQAVMAGGPAKPARAAAPAPPADADRPRPKPAKTPDESTTTTAPAPPVAVDLGASAGDRVPPPPPVAAADPDDRTSWAKYLGAVAPMDTNEAGLAGAVFTWVNAERAAQGLPPLAWSGDMAHSARWWSLHMVGYQVGHSQVLALLPERYTRTSENVGAVDPGDAALIYEALAASPPHLANILDPRMDAIGIGVACAPGGRLYVTQHFGTRAPTTVVEGRAPVWHPDANARPAPFGPTTGPTRCPGSRPASQDPPDEPPTTTTQATTTTSPAPSSTSTSTTTTAPPPTSTSTSTSSTSSSTSTSSTSTSTSSTSSSTSTSSTSSTTTTEPEG